MKARMLLAALLAAVVATPAATAATGLLVGVDDDSLKWYAPTRALLTVYRDLGVQAVRVTVDWEPGLRALSRHDRTELDRVNVASWGLRVVIALGGPADAPPADPRSQDDYCAFAADLVRRYPAVNDLVVWTEPNAKRFWRDPSPAAYEALLAHCWDVLHAVRPRLNLIAASAPHASPGAWFAGLGAALRSSGRSSPILDTFGHNVYPDGSAEAPSARHTNGHLDQGDYDRLVATLRRAFAGTAQPVASIWYLEDGFQSTVDAGRGRYSGSETDHSAVAEETQAAQLAAAVRLAACQPLVGAFFNFELRDETALAGWQSGLLRADWSPKPAYASFRGAIADVTQGRVSCR